jgi:hypothetical protein
MSNRRRTETVNPIFDGGMAVGWTFGVVDAFRTNLDIRYDKRIDSAASKTKELTLGRKLKPNEKVTKFVWTQGAPPAYAFARGHMFHEPPSAHSGSWSEALPILRRSIVILNAKPDSGYLAEMVTPDDNGDETTKVIESESESDSNGWVDFEILHYKDGRLMGREKSSRSQSGFVQLLRSGLFDQIEANYRPEDSSGALLL